MAVKPVMEGKAVLFKRFAGTDGVPIGPILLGCDIAAHIVTPGTTVRGLVNMTAIAAARIGAEEK